MNIKLVNLVQILEHRICLSPVEEKDSNVMCVPIRCVQCPANIKNKEPDDIKVRAVRGIINEQGVE